MQSTATLRLDPEGKVYLRIENPDGPTELSVWDSIPEAIDKLNEPGWLNRLGEPAVDRFVNNLNRIILDRVERRVIENRS